MSEKRTRDELHPPTSRSRLPRGRRRRLGHQHVQVKAGLPFDWGAVVKSSWRKGWPALFGGRRG